LTTVWKDAVLKVTLSSELWDKFRYVAVREASQSRGLWVKAFSDGSGDEKK